jgi:surface polysaccharide O-acyltransferase-like enzyme
MMLVYIDDSLLMIGRHIIGIYVVHGWMHFFMVQFDYRLVHG